VNLHNSGPEVQAQVSEPGLAVTVYPEMLEPLGALAVQVTSAVVSVTTTVLMEGALGAAYGVTVAVDDAIPYT
jgi:hypothetical protein